MDFIIKKGAVYSKRPAQNTFRENMWPRLINIADGPCFRKIRRIYSSFMTMEQVDRFKVYQDFESKVMLSELLEQPEEFIRHVERVSASVIFSATYGVRLVKMDHVIIHQLSGLWEEILQCKLIYLYIFQPQLGLYRLGYVRLGWVGLGWVGRWQLLTIRGKGFYPGAIPIDYIPALERLPKSMQSWTNLAEKLKGKEMGLHRAFFTMLKKSTVGKEQVTPECFGKMLIQVTCLPSHSFRTYILRIDRCDIVSEKGRLDGRRRTAHASYAYRGRLGYNPQRSQPLLQVYRYAPESVGKCT